MDFASKKDIVGFTKMTPMQVQYFIEEYGIEPEPGTGEGRGKVRQFGKRAQLIFLLISKLGEYGIKPKVVRYILDSFGGLLAPETLKKTHNYLVIFERDHGRYIKPQLTIKTDKGFSISAKDLEGWDSFFVIDFEKLLARLN